MSALSYNLSPTLKELLLKIEALRKQILTSSIAPETLYRFRWETAVAKIHYSLQLLGITKADDEIAHILSTYLGLKRIPPAPKQIVNYKRSLDHIWQTWLGNSQTVKLSHLEDIANVLDVRLENKPETEQVLQYIQTENVNPIIQAALIHLPQSNTPLAYLVPGIFLAKGGFHLKGLVNLEKQFATQVHEYRELVYATARSTNVTLWLEFFARCLMFEIEDIRQRLNHPTKPNIVSSKLLALSDRQKALLAMFDQPSVAITNRRVQEIFKVSQITASRDLSRLAVAGLIFVRGGGRSIYYTKI